MKTIRVHLSERSYDICFGRIGNKFITHLKGIGFSSGRRLFLVTSRALQKTGHLKFVIRVLKKGGYLVTSVVIPDGEKYKNIETLRFLYKKGFEAHLDRKSVVVALGGGVITDLAGFFASTYMRGIDYISIPSTLLSMVDASIGGKTGIDMTEGKNLVGAFWQPRLVWIDPTLLKTLPAREWKTGFAEVIKYGIIKDAPFFSWLQSKIAERKPFPEWPAQTVQKAIFRSAQIKAAVVSQDERETPLGGGREILNFGHTVGHALEASFSYGKLSHGEAISIGMNIASQISLLLRLWPVRTHHEMLDILKGAGLPTRFPMLNKNQQKLFWSALRKDKKHVSGNMRFVLPHRIGGVRVISGILSHVVRKAVIKGSKVI